jgi:hypothetical protein
MPCLSFTAPGTRSIVSFLMAYIPLSLPIPLIASTRSRYSCHMCLVSSFCPLSLSYVSMLLHAGRYMWTQSFVQSVIVHCPVCLQQQVILLAPVCRCLISLLLFVYPYSMLSSFLTLSFSMIPNGRLSATSFDGLKIPRMENHPRYFYGFDEVRQYLYSITAA